MAKSIKADLYKKAVYWIAHNDEPTETEISEIEVQVSVLLVADIFDKTNLAVAQDVQELRG